MRLRAAGRWPPSIDVAAVKLLNAASCGKSLRDSCGTVRREFGGFQAAGITTDDPPQPALNTATSNSALTCSSWQSWQDTTSIPGNRRISAVASGDHSLAVTAFQRRGRVSDDLGSNEMERGGHRAILRRASCHLLRGKTAISEECVRNLLSAGPDAGATRGTLQRSLSMPRSTAAERSSP